MNLDEEYEVRKREFLERLVKVSAKGRSAICLQVDQGLAHEINGSEVLWRGLDYPAEYSQALFIVDPPAWLSKLYRAL